MTRALLVLCLALAITVVWGAAEAQATTPTGDTRLDRALQVANIVWNNPCGGNADVVFEQLPNGVTAQVQGRRPCTIVFDPEDYASLDYLWVCSYTEHEMGHVAKFLDPLNPRDMTHSHRTDSIMNALFNQDERRCGHESIPFLALQGTPATPLTKSTVKRCPRVKTRYRSKAARKRATRAARRCRSRR